MIVPLSTASPAAPMKVVGQSPACAISAPSRSATHDNALAAMGGGGKYFHRNIASLANSTGDWGKQDRRKRDSAGVSSARSGRTGSAGDRRRSAESDVVG